VALFSGCQDPTLSKASPPPYLLVEKGPYQSLYVGFTRSRRGEPDYWEVVAPDGSTLRREYDDDGDGKVDRSEP
jgi:hypothetical protein